MNGILSELSHPQLCLEMALTVCEPKMRRQTRSMLDQGVKGGRGYLIFGGRECIELGNNMIQNRVNGLREGKKP